MESIFGRNSEPFVFGITILWNLMTEFWVDLSKP